MIPHGLNHTHHPPQPSVFPVIWQQKWLMCSVLTVLTAGRLQVPSRSIQNVLTAQWNEDGLILLLFSISRRSNPRPSGDVLSLITAGWPSRLNQGGDDTQRFQSEEFDVKSISSTCTHSGDTMNSVSHLKILSYTTLLCFFWIIICGSFPHGKLKQTSKDFLLQLHAQVIQENVWHLFCGYDWTEERSDRHHLGLSMYSEVFLFGGFINLLSRLHRRLTVTSHPVLKGPRAAFCRLLVHFTTFHCT